MEDTTLIDLFSHPDPVVVDQGLELARCLPAAQTARLSREMAVRGQWEMAAFMRWGRTEGERRLRLFAAWCGREWLEQWRASGWLPHPDLWDAVQGIEAWALGQAPPKIIRDLSNHFHNHFGCHYGVKKMDDFFNDGFDHYREVSDQELIGGVRWGQFSATPVRRLSRAELAVSREPEEPDDSLIWCAVSGIMGAVESIEWPGDPPFPKQAIHFYLCRDRDLDMQMWLWDAAMAARAVTSRAESSAPGSKIDRKLGS